MKPRLLFLSPVVPSHCGNGPAMRAHSFVRVLSNAYDIHLLVTGYAAAEPPGLRELCREVAVVPLPLWPERHAKLKQMLAGSLPHLYRRCFPRPSEWRKTARCTPGAPFAVREFEVAHVFRLYMAPVLESLRATHRFRSTWLDMDDVESTTRRDLAALHRKRGERGAAAKMEIESEQYQKIELESVRGFDRVFVCSADDRDDLATRGIHRSPEVAPNVVSAPRAAPAREPGALFTFLYVGTLGYLPNADGLKWFCDEVLPRLREEARKPFRVKLVGRGMTSRLAASLARCPEVEPMGYVADIESVYAQADAAIVPLRAGGGTSIKLVEAMAHGLPVVATPAGARGIGVVSGRHALVADSANPFAAACAQLVRSEEDRRRLGAEGRRLVEATCSETQLTGALLDGRFDVA